MNHLFATYTFQTSMDNVENGTRFAARPLKQWRKQYQNKSGFSRASVGMPMDRPAGFAPSTPKNQCNTCQGAFPMRLTLFKDSNCKSCKPIRNIVTPLKNQDKPRKESNFVCCSTIVNITHLEKAALAANAFTISAQVFNQEAFNTITSGLPNEIIASNINAYNLAVIACTAAATAFTSPSAATFIATSNAFSKAVDGFTNALIVITEFNRTSDIFPDIINVFNLATNAFIIPYAKTFTNVVELIAVLPNTNPVITLLIPFTEGAAAF